MRIGGYDMNDGFLDIDIEYLEHDAEGCVRDLIFISTLAGCFAGAGACLYGDCEVFV